jgi:hypothetical protein
MGEGRPTHNATYQIIVRSDLAKPKRFLKASFRLNDDSSGDAHAGDRCSQVIYEKIPAQHLHAI